MVRIILSSVAAAALLAMAGCGGRAASPVALDQSLDAELSCDHLDAEKRTNTARIADLEQEGSTSDANSVGMALAGGIWWLDGRQGAAKDAKALDARNARLDELMAERGC